jgi:hypothetical protein
MSVWCAVRFVSHQIGKNGLNKTLQSEEKFTSSSENEIYGRADTKSPFSIHVINFFQEIM